MGFVAPKSPKKCASRTGHHENRRHKEGARHPPISEHRTLEGWNRIQFSEMNQSKCCNPCPSRAFEIYQSSDFAGQNRATGVEQDSRGHSGFKCRVVSAGVLKNGPPNGFGKNNQTESMKYSHPLRRVVALGCLFATAGAFADTITMSNYHVHRGNHPAGCSRPFIKESR